MMVVYQLDYPFVTTWGKKTVFYGTYTDAMKNSQEEYEIQEEREDKSDSHNHESRQRACLKLWDSKFSRDMLIDQLNGKTVTLPTGELKEAWYLLYRKGKVTAETVPGPENPESKESSIKIADLETI